MGRGGASRRSRMGRRPPLGSTAARQTPPARRRWTGSRSPGRLLSEKHRRLLEELPLHPQLGDLPPEPPQLVALAAGQPLGFALVDAVLFDPLPQRLPVEAELSGDLGDGLVTAAYQCHRVTAELGWVDACHPEPPLDGLAAHSRGVRETGSTPGSRPL